MAVAVAVVAAAMRCGASIRREPDQTKEGEAQ
jgi:hypothetical protein